MPAFEAQAQVNPTIARLQTILAPIRAWRDLVNMVEIRTLLCHGYLSLLAKLTLIINDDDEGDARATARVPTSRSRPGSQHNRST